MFKKKSNITFTDSGLKEWINFLYETKEFEPKMLSSDEEIIVSLINSLSYQKKTKTFAILLIVFMI